MHTQKNNDLSWRSEQEKIFWYYNNIWFQKPAEGATKTIFFLRITIIPKTVNVACDTVKLYPDENILCYSFVELCIAIMIA